MSEAGDTFSAAPIRQAARVLLLDGDGRVLLFRFVDPVSGAPFWITPGGGLEGNETFEDAAKRELFEETGVVADDRLSPCVWTRTLDIVYGDRRFRQHERYFVLREDRPGIDTARMHDYEVTDLTEHRWWSVDEIHASPERFAPSRLAALLPSLLSEDANARWPIDVGR
jgi:8-oxo-dGTP pyrophosphatase MutT (NUDIX family)